MIHSEARKRYLRSDGVFNTDDGDAREASGNVGLVVPVRLLTTNHLHVVRILLSCFHTQLRTVHTIPAVVTSAAQRIAPQRMCEHILVFLIRVKTGTNKTDEKQCRPSDFTRKFDADYLLRPSSTYNSDDDDDVQYYRYRLLRKKKKEREFITQRIDYVIQPVIKLV